MCTRICVCRGWLGVSLFIYLLDSRVGGFLFCYHGIAPYISKGDTGASGICHLWRFISLDWYIGEPSYASLPFWRSFL